jgi:hypothetical protein
MDYFQARTVRKTPLSDLIASEIAGGGGVTSSIGKGISQKTSAAMTGIKQRFDPLNIAKFVTGGSNLAPAILGRMTGRKSKDIKFFTGKRQYDTASKIKPVEAGDGLNDILGKMLSLMQSISSDEQTRRDQANQFAEELALERAKRHKELIEAITGKPYAGNPKTLSATKIPDSPKGSLLDDLLTGFGLGSGAMSILKTIGKVGMFFATNPVGLAILGAATLGALFYKMFTSEGAFEDPNSDLSKGLRQAQEVGGLAGVLDEEERRKKLPEYDRTMAELMDYETYRNEGEKLTNKQLEGFAKRGPGALEAVEDYKAARDKYQKIVGETPAAVPTPVTTPATPMSAPAAVEEPATMPETGAKLNQVQSENLNLNIPESKDDPTSIINNNSVKSYAEGTGKIPMPAVRNTEPTFSNMILSSTRVV